MNENEAIKANLLLIDPAQNPVHWNLNRGIQDLVLQVGAMHALLQEQARQIAHIRDFLETAPSR